MIEIGVVIPVYNIEAYLPKCLESVIAQGSAVKEIVVVNDGSTDGSIAVCRAFAERDPRIRIVDKENGGVYSAVLAGVAATACPFIGFVDGDDYIEPDAFSRAAARAEETGADVVVWDYDQVSEQGECIVTVEMQKEFGGRLGQADMFVRENGKFGPLNLFPDPDGRPCVRWTRWNKLFRRSLFENNPMFARDYGVALGEDFLMVESVLARAKTIAYLPANLYHYVRRETSATHVPFNERVLSAWTTIYDVLHETDVLGDLQADNIDNTMWLFFFLIVFHAVKRLSRKDRVRALKKAGALPQVQSVLRGVDLKGATFKKRITTFCMRHKLYGTVAFLLGFVKKGF